MACVTRTAIQGEDPGSFGWGAVFVINGKALDRGTKCRAGWGMGGGGDTPLPD